MRVQKIQAVIFDVDGVLLDSVPYHFNAWKKLFNEYGIKFTFDDYLQKVNGLPRLTGIKNILPQLNNNELEIQAEKKQNYFLAMVSKKPPKPLSGVVKLLKKLKKLNIKTAAASSSKNSPYLLKKAGLDTYFYAIISGNDFVHSKPHPDIFITASKKLSVSSESCVVVEDAAIGIQAAKNADMKTIGVLTSNDTTIVDLADLTMKSMEDQSSVLNYILQ